MRKVLAILICLAIMMASVSAMMYTVFAKETPTITCESKECKAGDTITVDVTVSNNPGIVYLEVTPSYSAELGTPSIENGDFISDLTKGKNLVWVSDEDVTKDGKLVSFTFNLSDTIVPGDYSLNLALRGAYNYDEQSIAFTVVPAKITVTCEHETTHPVPAQASTCTVPGHGAYTVCDICGKVIDGSAEELPLIPHNYVENVASDYLASAATCVAKATYYKSCSYCKAASTETFEYGEKNRDNHVGSTYLLEQKEATCYSKGYTGDKHCSSCNGLLEQGKDIDMTPHSPASVWSANDDDHWHVCETIGCGNIIGREAHRGGVATCKDRAVCEVCRTPYGKTNPNNHTGNDEIIGYVAPTCTEEGFTGDIYCKDCDVKLEDGTNIPKISHSIEKWDVTKEATTSEEGEKTGKCTACGQEFTTKIAKLTSKPVEDVRISGMVKEPKLEPEGKTVLPSDVIFEAKKVEQKNLSSEQQTDAKKAVEEVKKKIDTIIGNGKKLDSVSAVCVLDLSLYIHNFDTASGDDLGYEEYHFDGSVKVTVEKPAEMKVAKNPCLVHIKDDGTSEMVNYTDNGDDTISFIATGFSSYVVVDVASSEIKNEDTNNTQTTQDTTKSDLVSPTTSDINSVALWILLIVSSLGLFVLCVKKDNA